MFGFNINKLIFAKRTGQRKRGYARNSFFDPKPIQQKHLAHHPDRLALDLQKGPERLNARARSSQNDGGSCFVSLERGILIQDHPDRLSSPSFFFDETRFEQRSLCGQKARPNGDDGQGKGWGRRL